MNKAGDTQYEKACLKVLDDLYGTRFLSGDSAREDDAEKHADLLRVLIDSLPENIYAKDREGRFVLCNLSTARLFGKQQPDAIIGHTDFDYHSRELAAQYNADERDVLERGIPIENREEIVIDHEGREHWFSTTKLPLRNAQGRIIGLAGIGHDITDLKRAKAQATSLADRLRAQHETTQEDLKLARDFQQSILRIPRKSRAMTVDAEGMRLAIAQCYIPCNSVSGDFLDIRRLSDSVVAVLVCDAMGHGVRAALLTAALNGLVTDSGSAAHQPAAFLGKLNQRLRDIITGASDAMFVTAVYAVFDLGEGEITFANAGHPPPLLRDGTEGEITVLECGEACPALGLLENAAYTSRKRPLHAGDTFLFSTDGLGEVESPKGELFESARMEAELRAAPRTAVQWIDHMTRAARDHAGRNGAFEDDVSSVVVQVEQAR